MPRVSVSGIISAPREEVFRLWTAYGNERKVRAFPAMQSQRVISLDGNVAVVENVFNVGGRTITDRRRYVLYPPERIEETILESPGVWGTMEQRFEEVPEGTRVTLVQDLHFKGFRFFLAPLLQGFLQGNAQEVIVKVQAFLKSEGGGTRE
ncbi:MAG: SRPBCC family protein [Chloroflexi bacterium]|nr:SRPBCC family protein [Chloroflexota bacterium]